MSEVKTYPIYTVKPEAIATIPISGHFYKRISGAYFTFISKFSSEEAQEIMEAIAQKKIDTLIGQKQIDAYSVETMIMLMGSIEFTFKEAGDIKKTDVTIPTEG